MTAVKLKLATAVAVAAVFAVAGGALVSGQFPDQPPDPNSRPPVATRATSGGSTPAAQPPGNFGGIPGGGGTRGQRPPAATPGENARSFNNLKQIALAVHNYVDVNGHFPNIFTDEQGQPTLSWRVALLPYLEQDHLYKQFHLDEPWDSPHNKELLTRMPDVFRAPTQEPGSTDTYYQGFTGRSTLFERGREIHFPDITDGTSNTILVVEGGPPVPWTKPVDVLYSANKPLPRLEGPFSDVLNVAMADGSARALRRPLKESIFRAAITRDGGEVVDLDELSPSQPKPPAAQERGGGAPGDYLNEARMRAEIEAQRAEQARLLEQARLAEQQRADDVARLRRDVEALRDQVQRLQSEVDRLKRGRRE